MSSLKMTFSLTSLILIIALGLVFAPTAVMGHSESQLDTTGDDDVADIDSHTHDGMTPVEAVAPDSTATPPVLGVPAHNSHPTVEITLKPSDNVSSDGTTVMITDADGDPTTADGQTFTLVIDFDQIVLDTAGTSGTVSVAPTTAQLVAGDLSRDIQDMTEAVVIASDSTGITIGTPTVVDDDYSKYEAVVTIADAAGIPSGTADEDDETLTFRIFLDEECSVQLSNTRVQSPKPGAPAPEYLRWRKCGIEDLRVHAG